jgi:hypothetical protein
MFFSAKFLQFRFWGLKTVWKKGFSQRFCFGAKLGHTCVFIIFAAVNDTFPAKYSATFPFEKNLEKHCKYSTVNIFFQPIKIATFEKKRKGFK